MNRKTELETFTLEDIDDAKNLIIRLCRKPEAFTMSIPPQRSDSDILLSRCITRLEDSESKIDSLKEENEMLWSIVGRIKDFSSEVKEELSRAQKERDLNRPSPLEVSSNGVSKRFA